MSLSFALKDSKLHPYIISIVFVAITFTCKIGLWFLDSYHMSFSYKPNNINNAKHPSAKIDFSSMISLVING